MTKTDHFTTVNFYIQATFNLLLNVLRKIIELFVCLLPATPIILSGLIIFYCKKYGEIKHLGGDYDFLGNHCQDDKPYLLMPSIANCARMGPAIYDTHCMSLSICVESCHMFIDHSLPFGLDERTLRNARNCLENKTSDVVCYFKGAITEPHNMIGKVDSGGDICVPSRRFIPGELVEKFNFIPVVLNPDNILSGVRWYRRFKKVSQYHLHIGRSLRKQLSTIYIYLIFGMFGSLVWCAFKVLWPNLMINLEIVFTLSCFIYYIRLAFVGQETAQYAEIYESSVIDTVEQLLTAKRIWAYGWIIIVSIFGIWGLMLVNNNMQLKAIKKTLKHIVFIINEKKRATVFIVVFFILEMGIILYGVRVMLLSLSICEKIFVRSRTLLPLDNVYYANNQNPKHSDYEFTTFQRKVGKWISVEQCLHPENSTDCYFLKPGLKRMGYVFIVGSYLMTIWTLITCESLIYILMACTFSSPYKVKELLKPNSMKFYHFLKFFYISLKAASFNFLTKPFAILRMIFPVDNWVFEHILSTTSEYPLAMVGHYGVGYEKYMWKRENFRGVAIGGVKFIERGAELSTYMAKFILSTLTAVMSYKKLRLTCDSDIAFILSTFIVFVCTFRSTQIALQMFDVAVKVMVLKVYDDVEAHDGSPTSPYESNRNLLELIHVRNAAVQFDYDSDESSESDEDEESD